MCTQLNTKRIQRLQKTWRPHLPRKAGGKNSRKNWHFDMTLKHKQSGEREKPPHLTAQEVGPPNAAVFSLAGWLEHKELSGWEGSHEKQVRTKNGLGTTGDF